MASFENGKLSAVWFDQGPHAEGVASAERRKARVQLLMLMQRRQGMETAVNLVAEYGGYDSMPTSRLAGKEEGPPPRRLC